MERQKVLDELAKPISRELLDSHIPARFAFTGTDGFPRVVPVAFLWTGSEIVTCTTTNAKKNPALRQHPKVALTIDTEGYPPRVLLIRGTARTEVVDGVPEEYVEASRKIVPVAEMEQWEGGVRMLYPQMVKITITPEWARLQDFQTTLPQNVEEILRSLPAPAK
ncbi:pyridoxamine 5'-phosphate oxidase family protein [Fodinicola acaciae]|uniref:pyridoxamine 5'-phosphate oxidase family protein n=1 Tax=Fodinicola acaciae TaxID=2681555 RepID=UPI0013D31007|nr:pyridoxamine 5'-phosphate oxidase family protein [Fodinicola acaciae]